MSEINNVLVGNFLKSYNVLYIKHIIPLKKPDNITKNIITLKKLEPMSYRGCMSAGTVPTKVRAILGSGYSLYSGQSPTVFG